MAGALEGRRIVVPESRELDLFVSMLEREGAEAVRCPLVAIHDVEDPAPVEAWLRRLAGQEMDDLVLFTGEGVKRLHDVAERGGVRSGYLSGLAAARKIVRGPKPTRVLRTLGLAPDLTAEVATSEGLTALLSGLDLAGRRVGMQAYPGQPEDLDRFIAARGGTVDRVLPYRYASDREDERVAEVIIRMAGGGIDMIAFTSRPQVVRLQEVARKRGVAGELDRAMGAILVASVGPVTTEALRKAGWRVDAAPEDNFHLKPFVGTIRAMLAERPLGQA